MLFLFLLLLWVDIHAVGSQMSVVARAVVVAVLRLGDIIVVSRGIVARIRALMGTGSAEVATRRGNVWIWVIELMPTRRRACGRRKVVVLRGLLRRMICLVRRRVWRILGVVAHFEEKDEGV